jgi:RNA polymerase sigma-70 factor (ECF subfamily)
VVEISDGEIVGLNFFLDTDTLFPMFGLPPVPPASAN